MSPLFAQGRAPVRELGEHAGAAPPAAPEYTAESLRAAFSANIPAGIPPDPKLLQALIALDPGVARQVIVQVLRADVAAGRRPDGPSFVAFANLDPAGAWEMAGSLAAVNAERARELMVALHRSGRVPPNLPKEAARQLQMLTVQRRQPRHGEPEEAGDE